MTTHGTVYLVGSGQDGVLEQVARRAVHALGKDRPRVAVTYAPVSGDARGLKFMTDRMGRLFPGAVLETIEDDPAVVERADLVFVSGGDPTLGAKVLEASGAAQWLRQASARGVPVMGVSAGSIVLGAWWADWPEDDSEELDDIRLVACTRVVDGHVFDTHNEEDGWDELRIVAELCDRRGESARFLGIPTGGALVFAAGGGMEVVGEPPFTLR
jgi:putative intracellular protease/amidase